MSRPEVEESLRALRVSAFTCFLVSSRAETREARCLRSGRVCGARRREGSAVSSFPTVARCHSERRDATPLPACALPEQSDGRRMSRPEVEESLLDLAWLSNKPYIFSGPASSFISRGAQAPFPIRKRLSSSPVKCPPSTPVNQGCPSSPTGRLLWKETYDVPWQGVENPPQVPRGASSSARAISSLIAMPSWTALPSCFRTSGRGNRPRLWDPSGMFSAKSPPPR